MNSASVSSAAVTQRKRFSWGVKLLARTALCVLALLAYRVTSSAIPVLAMLVIAVASLRAVNFRTSLALAISLLILLHALWTTVLVAAAVFELIPVAGTPVRWGVFEAGHLASAVLGASQLLYLLTLALHVTRDDVDFRFSSRLWRQWPLFVLVVACSIAINGTAFVLHGGYTGNTNVYWAGLPAVFVVLVSACFLRSRVVPLSLWIFINLVVGYWVLTGNRSEVLFLFVFANTCYLSSRVGFRSRRLRAASAGGVLLLGFILFSIVGLMRSTDSASSLAPSLSSVFYGIVQGDRLNVSTVGSSVYSGLVAIDVAATNGLYYGETFIGQLRNVIPSFVPTPWSRYTDPYEDYQAGYQMMGGFGLLGESHLNFGPVGPVLLGVLLVLFLRALIIRAPRSVFASWFLLAFAMYSQRYFFYGYVYLHNMVLLFLVIGLVVLVSRRAVGKAWATR